MADAPPALVPELSVTDWQASRAFYVGLLGFDCAYDRPEDGFAYLTRGPVHLMIDQLGQGRDFDPDLTAAQRPFGRGMNLQITVPDLAPILTALAEAGWPLHMAVEDRWYRKGAREVGNRQCLVADPDGYLLRLCADLGDRPARGAA